MFDQLVQHIRRYAPLSDEDATLLLTGMEFRELKKKDFILKPGQVCEGHHFVLSGLCRTYFLNDKEAEQIIHFALENWWITDHSSLDRQTPSHFYIQAVEDTSLATIRRSAQEELFRRIPALDRYFRIILQKAMAASQMRMKYLYGLTGKERYEHFSSLFPEFVQRVPQYMLASYLGFSPEFLSKIRANKVPR